MLFNEENCHVMRLQCHGDEIYCELCFSKDLLALGDVKMMSTLNLVWQLERKVGHI
jgi:hypothetical protein